MSDGSKLTVSPLAPAAFPALPEVGGVRVATGNSATRYKGRDDLLVALMAKGTTVAGRFTLSQMPSAPVDWCKDIIGRGKAAALVVNAGNANAFTGKVGAQAVCDTANALAVPARQIFIASTGVIGEPLNGVKIGAKAAELALKAKSGGWEKAANAIRTTDTFAKGASATCEIDGKPVTIAGIAKGSGMIEPALGTMLSFIWTDAALPADVLDKLIGPLVDASYNAITVDSDTSTSDTLLVFATGAAKTAKVERAGDPKLKAFKTALGAVMQDLALQIVRDGEGAQKLISVEVTGAKSKKSAMKIAKAIANSPLVKTAVAGEDPNWGRIVMAVGKAGEPANRDKLSIDIGGIKVARKGLVVPGYDEAPVAQHMKGRSIEFTVDVGIGKGEATAYTCDLTHGYISINADYRS